MACEFPLPGIPEVAGGEADIRVEVGLGPVDDRGYDGSHCWRETGGNLVLTCARRAGADGTFDYLLRFPELVDFHIGGDLVTCYLHPGCRDDSLRHLLLDQVIPRLWAHRGHLVLHASAARLGDGRVLAFTGESGWGKSTLVAALQSSGARLLADDSLWLKPVDGRAQVVPSYSGLRLNDDSIHSLALVDRAWDSVSHYSAKRRLLPDSPGGDEPLWLDVLFLLQEPGDTGQLSISPPAGADSLATLIKRCFLLDVHDRCCAARQMAQAALVLRATPVVRCLAYPHDFSRLPEVCAAVLGVDGA